jgi:DNA-binding NarL/FixJ family response regulator
MHHPQIVVFERDGLLAGALAALVETERWPLRGSRQLESCLRLLRQPGPGVLVVKIGKPAERDLALVEQVSWQLPNVPVVVVGDVEDAAVLAGLAWDVGASYALFPPLSRDLLPEVVAGLMRSSIARTFPAVRSSP